MTETRTIKIAIVEDLREIREGLARLINATPGYRCTGVYASMEDALDKIPNNLPDLVLSDIGLPGIDGISGIAILKQRYPDLLILMLTVYDDNGRIFDALCAGACGYLLKKTPWEKVVDAGTHQVRSSRESLTPRPHKMIQTRTNCAFQYVKSALSI